jgi:hypothetical protein
LSVIASVRSEGFACNSLFATNCSYTYCGVDLVCIAYMLQKINFPEYGTDM